MCDLDGVVRRGGVAVPHAVPVLTDFTATGGQVTYATNNASLTPVDVAAQLVGLGLRLTQGEVLTSAQAGAAHVADLFDQGTKVLAVGGPGVAQALREQGLVPVTVYEADVVAVLQGYGPAVTAGDLAEASYAIENGATWVASNTDTTLPTERGIAPGNGSLVAAVSLATKSAPIVRGKPQPPMYDLAVERMGVDHDKVLGVGDRLDTDILGALRARLDVLWVLSGVDDLRSLARDPARVVPTYVGEDLRALSLPVLQASSQAGWWRCADVGVRLNLTDRSVTGVDVDGLDGTGGVVDDAMVGAVLECATRALLELRDAAEPLGEPVLLAAADELTAIVSRIRERSSLP